MFIRTFRVPRLSGSLTPLAYPLQAVIILSTMTAISLYIKRFKWTPIKNRKLFYNPPKGSH